MKVIFLDIDGVLNSVSFYVHKFAVLGGENAHENYPNGEFCKFNIANLNHIVAKTGASIVVSSNWRHRGDVNHLKELLGAQGVVGNIVDKTPSTRDEFRGTEVDLWLKDNKVQNYVILDDDGDFLDGQLDKLVQTDYKIGLTRKDAETAISILIG